MPEFQRRTILSMFAGMGALTSVFSSVDGTSTESGKLPLTNTSPSIPSRHNLDQSGTLQVSFNTEPKSPTVDVFTYPDGRRVTSHITPNKKNSETVYTFELGQESLPTGTTLTCLFYDARGTNISNWMYTGETAPFTQSNDRRFVRSYSGAERPTDTMYWTYSDTNDGESIQTAPIIHRETKDGYYEITAESGFYARNGFSFLKRAIQVDIGKLAFARATDGNPIRDPSIIFEKARESRHVRKLLAAINDLHTVPDDAALFHALIGFVQDIPYRSDTSSVQMPDYAKHPVETLVGGGGDCEDKAILLAALFDQSRLEADPILVFPPEHASIAIRNDSVPKDLMNEIGQDTITVGGDEYLYIETVQPSIPGHYPVLMTGVSFERENMVAIYSDGNWVEFNPDKIVSTARNQVENVSELFS